MTAHVVSVADGVELHVEDDGAGSAIVLLNGAFCTVRQWDLVVERLAPRFRLIRLDIRGSGRSGAGPEEDNRFTVYARDILAVLDQRGVDRADLWGMAWGSRVALVAAAEHPERFRRVVLSDLGITKADTEAQKAGVQEAEAARAAAAIEDPAKPEGWKDHDDFELAAKAMSATFEYPDLIDFVCRVTQRTLVPTGEFDPNLESSRRSVDALPDGHLEVVPLAGHASVLQRPFLLADLVEGFLLAD